MRSRHQENLLTEDDDVIEEEGDDQGGIMTPQGDIVAPPAYDEVPAAVEADSQTVQPPPPTYAEATAEHQTDCNNNDPQ